MAHLVGERLDRPADVVRQQSKRLGNLRRELPNPQLAVKEDRADLGAGQQVVHVVGQLGQLGDLALVLGVDGVELLVHALQFLVGALQLLVRRLQFFVRRLQFLVARFELFDRGLQAFLRRSQFRFERGQLLLRHLVDVDLNRRRRTPAWHPGTALQTTPPRDASLVRARRWRESSRDTADRRVAPGRR